MIRHTICFENPNFPFLLRGQSRIECVDILHRTPAAYRYALHIPIGSLMNVLNIKPFEYLNPKKFLEADQNMIGEFSKTINAKNLNVGISWKSLNPDQPHRNINISLLLNSLKKIPNIKIHNLQFGLDKGEIDNININKLVYYKNVDYKNDLNTIAAIIENMDFVITIQNTVAHLSCALQKKTLLLLPMGSRWYWGLENFDRWYGCGYWIVGYEYVTRV